MPTNREKRPRWLMICKCGATVKASAGRAEMTPLGVRPRRAAVVEGTTRLTAGRQSGQAAGSDRSGNPAGSGVRDDRGALERGDDPLQGELALAGALEQHPPFEGARAHDGKPGHDVFPHGP